MSCSRVLAAFSRLSLHGLSSTRNISTNVNALCFRVTAVSLAEPMKKKKKLDPAIVRAREEKRKKKLQKAIRKLEKSSRQLKPVTEMQIPFKLEDEREQRLRKLPPLSEEVLEQRILLGKDWTRYKLREHLADLQMMDTMLYSQQRALDELRAESETLYRQAIQLDTTIVPVVMKGPCNTPPIKDYDSPDGDYTNITKKFLGEE